MSVLGTYLKINRNTVCVYTSFPNYPYGTVDPI
jgi:glutamate/tyrosine decarboxylase-like PLP-dependent enzyme